MDMITYIQKVMKEGLRNSLSATIFMVIFTFNLTAGNTKEGSVIKKFFKTNQGYVNIIKDSTEVAYLFINEADPSQNKLVVETHAKAGSKIKARVVFRSTKTTQRRLYITQNVLGKGIMPYNHLNLYPSNKKKDFNADGSIDLDGHSKKEVDLTFELLVPDVESGSVVYSFWTTKGKGDFRNPLKRIALGVGTITIKVGKGTNPFAKVREFERVKLYAPDQFGNSKSFFSLLNETVYKINQGPEFRAFWDFGYYYGTSGKSSGDRASFASADAYDASFGYTVKGLKPVPNEANQDGETLNEMWFAMSGMTSANFDQLELAGNLEYITPSNYQKITNLAVGDVIEFVDNYGKKGLIKITAIRAGFGNDDFIQFSVKIQQ